MPAWPCFTRHRPEKGLRDAGVVQPMPPNSGLGEDILQLSASVLNSCGRRLLFDTTGQRSLYIREFSGGE